MSGAVGKMFLLVTGIIYTVLGALGVFSTMFFGGIARDLSRALVDFESAEVVLGGIARAFEVTRNFLGAQGTGAENSDLIFIAFLASFVLLAFGFLAIIWRAQGEKTKLLVTFAVAAFVMNVGATFIPFLDDLVLNTFSPAAFVFSGLFWVAPVFYLAGAVLYRFEYAKYYSGGVVIADEEEGH